MPTSIRGEGTVALNLTALPMRLTNTCCSNVGSTCIPAARVRPTGRAPPRVVRAHLLERPRDDGRQLDRPPAGPGLRRSRECQQRRQQLRRHPSLAGESSSRDSATRANRPSASARSASSARCVMPANGPTRSCETMPLKLSRPAITSCNGCVASAGAKARERGASRIPDCPRSPPIIATALAMPVSDEIAI